jgi:hypothetical protein
MTDDFRDRYQKEVRRLAALHAETRPKHTLRQKLAALLGRQPKAVTVTPKRISGPRLVPPDWHTLHGQAQLPEPVLGPRCRNCSLPVFAGADTLHGLAGLCGKCMATLGGTIAAPPIQSTDNGPRAA